LEKNYDVIVGGGGIVGANIFRELSKYELRLALIEKEEDICSFGSTIANTGIIHGGYDPTPGSLKAELNILGKYIWKDLVKKLNIPSQFNGVLVLAYNKNEEEILNKLYINSKKNGVELEIISKEEIKKIEPNLRDDYTKGLFCREAGIIDPFIATFNLVKNGYENGGDVILDCEILDLIIENDSIKLITKKGNFETKIFINALGFFGKKFLEDKDLIFPRRGQYLVTDKNLKNLVSRPIFGVPTEIGKGITISPTPHGNLLLGPTSHKASFYDTSSNLKEKEEILEKVNKYIDFDFNQYIIRDFAGVRASSKTKDFIIGYEDGKNIIQVQGIDSPGLTSAPAIAKMVTELIKKKINIVEKKNFKDYLEPNIKIDDLDKNEADDFIQKNNNYGEIICRCEFVSKGEIIDALNSFPKPVNLDGLKRRLRVSSGRCGGSFCTIRIIKILNEYYGLDFTEIKKKGNKSNLVYGEIE